MQKEDAQNIDYSSVEKLAQYGTQNRSLMLECYEMPLLEFFSKSSRLSRIWNIQSMYQFYIASFTTRIIYRSRKENEFFFSRRELQQSLSVCQLKLGSRMTPSTFHDNRIKVPGNFQDNVRNRVLDVFEFDKIGICLLLCRSTN